MENKPKHTPGPWEIRHSIIDAPKSGIAIVMFDCPIKSQSEERRANAALIAAAPEMLEACHAAWAALDAKSLTRQKWTVKDQAAFEACTAAIAKAEGKGT